MIGNLTPNSFVKSSATMVQVRLTDLVYIVY